MSKMKSNEMIECQNVKMSKCKFVNSTFLQKDIIYYRQTEASDKSCKADKNRQTDKMADSTKWTEKYLKFERQYRYGDENMRSFEITKGVTIVCEAKGGI